jgi:hypothetical protein
MTRKYLMFQEELSLTKNWFEESTFEENGRFPVTPKRGRQVALEYAHRVRRKTAL